MTTTEAPEVTILRQPPPEQVDTLEQAVAALRLDPNPEHREGAYLTGWIEGGCAGLTYAVTGFIPDELADLLAESYGTSLAPLPFAAALAARPKHTLWADSFGYTAAALRHVGRLTGFRAEAVSGRDVAECPSCARLNITDVHDVAYCPLDGVWLCAGDRPCWASLCDGPRHARECRSES